MRRVVQVGGVAVAVAATVFALEYAGSVGAVAGTALVAALGVITTLQEFRRLVDGSSFVNTMQGYVVGSVLGLLVLTGMHVVIIGLPPYTSMWLSGRQIWDEIMLIGFVLVTANFVTGLIRS